MTIILFILILKSFLSCCPFIIFDIDNALKDSVYILFREVIIVLAGTVIIEGLAFYKVLQKEHGITYCILITLALWILMGSIMIAKA